MHSKLTLYVLWPILLFTLGACATHNHKLDYSAANHQLTSTVKFKVLQATDHTGYAAPKNGDQINIAEEMTNALSATLNKDNLLGNGSDTYTIQTDVLHYEPGNAFGRWLMPGLASSVVETNSTITSPEGVIVAHLPAKTAINAGGGFTIGAWKTIFNDVSKDISLELRQAMGIEAK